MTLTTHAVAGACIGLIAYHNPPFAMSAALISHPLLDTIPHWDYSLSSAAEDAHNPMNNDIKTGSKAFFIDLIKIGTDFWLGLIIPALFIYFTHTNLYVGFIILVCAFIAMAPDPLQFVYMKTRSKIVEPFQRFHMYMHAKLKLKNKPILGITSQIVIIVVLLIFMNNFR